MPPSIHNLLSSYDDRAPLAQASTIPAAWYVDPRLAELERLSVFSKTWQLVARIDQLQAPGQFISTFVAGEPVVTQPCGQAALLHCPYHGWNYGLDGSLKGMPEFEGVENFDRAQNGLVPIRVETWECFVFVNLDHHAAPLAEFF